MDKVSKIQEERQRLSRSFKFAFNMLVYSKLRSWLTIIGIVIGIAAVVSIVSITNGAEAELTSRLDALGGDIITITPGAVRTTDEQELGPPRFDAPGETRKIEENLTNQDVNLLRNVDNIKFAMGTISDRGDISYSSESATIAVNGVDIDVWEDITIEEVAVGRFLRSSDSRLAVVGDDVASSIFDREIQINRQIQIEGVTFTVVGILESGSSIYIPIDDAREVFDEDNNNFDSIVLKIDDESMAEETVALVEKRLMNSRGITREEDKDFTLVSQVQFRQELDEALAVFTMFLGSIAGISLVVGTVGISNTMFTSVMQKTRDIGIMKSIGAKRKDILTIFLLNSGMMGLMGGIGGVLLGSGVVAFVSFLGRDIPNFPFAAAYVDPLTITGALGISIIIGMLAGSIPAYRASKLNPVDALRYE